MSLYSWHHCFWNISWTQIPPGTLKHVLFLFLKLLSFAKPLLSGFGLGRMTEDSSIWAIKVSAMGSDRAGLVCDRFCELRRVHNCTWVLALSSWHTNKAAIYMTDVTFQACHWSVIHSNTGVVLLMCDSQLICAQDTDEKRTRRREKWVRWARNKVKGKTEKYTWTQFTFSYTSLASLERSGVQCDITYYFSIHPLWLRYRNGEQGAERQDYCEPNQEIEKCDEGRQLAGRQSGGVWMKEILQSEKQMDKMDGSLVAITE